MAENCCCLMFRQIFLSCRFSFCLSVYFWARTLFVSVSSSRSFRLPRLGRRVFCALKRFDASFSFPMFSYSESWHSFILRLPNGHKCSAATASGRDSAIETKKRKENHSPVYLWRLRLEAAACRCCRHRRHADKLNHLIIKDMLITNASLSLYDVFFFFPDKLFSAK